MNVARRPVTNTKRGCIKREEDIEDPSLSDLEISPTRSGKKRKTKTPKPIITGKVSPILIVRIERPYGGEIVLAASNVPGTVDYLDQVRNWFTQQPQELNLFSENASERGARELANFNHIASTEWPSPPIAVEMRYEAPKRVLLPPPIVGDDYTAVVGIERRGVSSFVLHARTDALRDTERGVAIIHREETHVAEIELRHFGHTISTLGPITTGELAEVRSAAARMSGVVEDVLDILVSNAIEHSADHEGYFSLEIDAILNARGLTKKHKGGLGGKSYAAGHHAEARDSVISAIHELNLLYVALRPEKFEKKKRLSDWDRVLNVQRFTLEEPSKRVHAIRYGLGTWFQRWKDDHALANRRILELDAKREAPAKILARYFTQRKGEGRRVVRKVREIFFDTATDVDQGKNPQRSRNWLENALGLLQQKKIIIAWAYVESLDALPRYKWLKPWLELHVAVTLK